MEILNLILNIIIISYIIVKEMGTIKRYIHNTIDLFNEYVMAFKKQLIIKLAENINAKVSFDDEISHDDNTTNNDLNDNDEVLLATCIAVGKDGHEEVVDFDFRGDSAAPLNFNMFGGTMEQHYDLDIVKSFNGEVRSTEHYYAFEQTVYDIKKQGKIVDSYVIVANTTLDKVKSVINKPIIIDEDLLGERDDSPIIDENSIIIDVFEEVAATEEVKQPEESDESDESKDDITLIIDEINAGVLDKEFLENMLKLNVDSIEKVFYAGTK